MYRQCHEHQQTLRNQSFYDFPHTELINQQQTVCKDGPSNQFKLIRTDNTIAQGTIM